MVMYAQSVQQYDSNTHLEKQMTSSAYYVGAQILPYILRTRMTVGTHKAVPTKEAWEMRR